MMVLGDKIYIVTPNPAVDNDMTRIYHGRFVRYIGSCRANVGVHPIMPKTHRYVTLCDQLPVISSLGFHKDMLVEVEVDDYEIEMQRCESLYGYYAPVEEIKFHPALPLSQLPHNKEWMRKIASHGAAFVGDIAFSVQAGRIKFNFCRLAGVYIVDVEGNDLGAMTSYLNSVGVVDPIVMNGIQMIEPVDFLREKKKRVRPRHVRKLSELISSME